MQSNHRHRLQLHAQMTSKVMRISAQKWGRAARERAGIAPRAGPVSYANDR
jgi:hypothetical protein